jgi:hypothetical protein
MSRSDWITVGCTFVGLILSTIFPGRWWTVVLYGVLAVGAFLKAWALGRPASGQKRGWAAGPVRKIATAVVLLIPVGLWALISPPWSEERRIDRWFNELSNTYADVLGKPRGPVLKTKLQTRSVPGVDTDRRSPSVDG